MKYLKEFGQQLMKSEPDLCLEIIQNLVQLTSIATNMRKRHDPSKGVDAAKSL